MNKLFENIIIGISFLIIGIVSVLFIKKFIIPLSNNITEKTVGNWTGLIGRLK